MAQITIADETLEKLEEQARSRGFADIPSYLDDLADEGYITTMTPALAAALEEGLEDIRQGRVVSEEAVLEEMARRRRERVEKAA